MSETSDDDGGDTPTSLLKFRSQKQFLKSALPAASKVDADAEFEQMKVIEWIADMLKMRLPLARREAITELLQSGYTKMAIQGFIAGSGPWRRRLMFFYQSVTAKDSKTEQRKSRTAGESSDYADAFKRAETLKSSDSSRATSPTRQERPPLHPLEMVLTLANPYRDELKDQGQCIYFLRITKEEDSSQALDSGKRLRLAHFEQHISCGEIVGGAESLNATASWLSELFVPILGRYLTDRLQNRKRSMWKCHIVCIATV
jgi:hypothetical protein